MPEPRKRPLTEYQEELLATVKATRKTAEVARRMKEREASRRIAEAKIQAQRDWDAIEAAIRIDVADEIAQHVSASDEALIAAYNAGVPVRRIALDGFGNRHDGNVHAALKALRIDGRVGNAVGYQLRNDSTEERSVEFPQLIDIETVLAEKAVIDEPMVTPLDGKLTLVEESRPGADDGIYVDAAVVKMDSRDPYFNTIKGNAREGTPYLHATTATIYLHPGDGRLVCHESTEAGELIWDHPVARFVKEYNDQVREEFDRVMSERDNTFPTSTI